MLKETSIVTGFLAVSGLIALAVGTVPATLLTVTTVIGLGVISVNTGIAHVKLNRVNSILHASLDSLEARESMISEKLDLEKAEVQFNSAQSFLAKKEQKNAFDCYLEAARLGHSDAWAPLERLGEEMNAERQKELSQLYKSMNNKKKADFWLEESKEAEGFIWLESPNEEPRNKFKIN